ncbi:MAG TPA: DsrE family protein [Pyrinomonadaceae bacterium]|nr:DsrE family protein [Pyrinomonadaceae bacterium]
MSRYIFIESRDPFESKDTRFIEETAVSVKERGHEVTVFLVQNAVLAARKSARQLGHLTEAGVTVLADDLSLRGRGIASEELAPNIRESGIEALVDALVQENTKALWH